MSFLVVLALAAASVQGVVTTDHIPLPGCLVILGDRITVTDADGKYSFDGVEPGRRSIHFELASFIDSRRDIAVVAGVNQLPAEELRTARIDETITLSCGAPCQSTTPSSVWEYPTCDDYALDDTLGENIRRGDRSAVALAEKRYEQAFTYAQKHRLAAALLHHAADDTPYWNELFEHARNYVRFIREDAGDSDELKQWCAGQGYDPRDYASMARETLWITMQDARSRALMLEALKTGDRLLVMAGISGLGRQRDLSALPAIEEALKRSGEEASSAAYGLFLYRDEQADQLAFRYLDADSREGYLEARNSPPEK
jgi:hypothetical protein